MGKRARDKASKKERRRADAAALAEAAALARSTWLSQAAGLAELDAPGAPPATAGRHAGRAAAGRPAKAGTPRAGRATRGTAPGVDPVVSVAAAEAAGEKDAHAEEAAPARRARGGALPASSLPIDATELAARLAGLSTVLQRELSRAGADAGDGLTRARLSALSLLVLGGPRTLGDLAAAEHVRPPTMTRLVHAMEADGLVTRERHPTDGRSIVIRATAEGEALLEHGRASRIVSLSRVIEGLDDAERQLLGDASDLLAQVLRASGRAPGDSTA
jgi:DNA-binding MarR family transcriptional regulator